MSDFKIVLDYVISMLYIKIPVFGFQLSILSMLIGFFILSMVIRVVVTIFRG